MKQGLNPRFDGAFLNFIAFVIIATAIGLNPRFDGAFLNCKKNAHRANNQHVLIPDLMGLF